MKRAQNIEVEMKQIGVVEDLTSVFESIASIHIGRIRDRVTASKEFFAELWHIYSKQLRLDASEQLGAARSTNGRTAFLVISSEGSLAGDIDERIVRRAIKDLQGRDNVDVMAMGHHGATIFKQRGIPVAHQFVLPEKDEEIDVTEVINTVADYSQTTVYYQEYTSLLVQNVAKIDLVASVQTLGQEESEHIAERDIITSQDYFFEPSVQEVARYMEAIMMEVVLSQSILESKLAQYASRYNAMSAANKRAGELKDELRMDFNRSRRAEKDARLKEVAVAMRLLNG